MYRTIQEAFKNGANVYISVRWSSGILYKPEWYTSTNAVSGPTRLHFMFHQILSDEYVQNSHKDKLGPEFAQRRLYFIPDIKVED